MNISRLCYELFDLQAVEALTSSWTLGPLKILRPGETYSFGVAYHLVEALMEELNHERKDDAVSAMIIILMSLC